MRTGCDSRLAELSVDAVAHREYPRKSSPARSRSGREISVDDADIANHLCVRLKYRRRNRHFLVDSALRQPAGRTRRAAGPRTGSSCAFGQQHLDARPVALVVVLVAARVVGAIFRKLHQPQVMGEVVAGNPARAVIFRLAGSRACFLGVVRKRRTLPCRDFPGRGRVVHVSGRS
jgi:hypothetical protein